MTWRVVLVILFISGFLVYATVDRTVYETEQLIVVPGSVTSDSFAGLEQVLVQDLSGNALYQNFSPDVALAYANASVWSGTPLVV